MSTRVVNTLTEELRKAKAEIQRLKKNERSRKYRANKKAAAKKIEQVVVVVKATTQKNERVVENKIPNTTDQEYQCWREYKKISSDKTRGKAVKVQEPSRKALALRYVHFEARHYRKLKNPNIKKIYSKYDNEMMTAEEETPKTPEPEEHTEVSTPDEEFNVNWRPTPAPRRFK